MDSATQSGKDSRKFLIVDDHTAFRQTIRAFLPEGRVAECSDSCELLECYAIEHPDWVLMDIEMPGLDGFTATRQLKLRFPQARVIFVSHHGEEDFRTAARDLGASGFVTKEHLEELVEIIAAGEGKRRQP